MQPPLTLRKVHLYGHLAEGIGKVIELAFRTPLEAVRLLEVNFPGFHKRMREGEYFVYVKRGKTERDLPMEWLDVGFTDGALHIMPRVIGARKGKGFLNVLIGGLIIGAAFFFSGGTLAGLATTLPGVFGATGATFGTLATMGAGLMLQGVGILLTPTPKTNYSSVDEKQSFVFNGPVNVTQQGGSLPLIFGKMMAGTVVISASLDVEMLIGGGDVFGVVGEDIILNMKEVNAIVPKAIDMADMVNVPEGARVKSINGVTTSGHGNMTVDGLYLWWDAEDDGDNTIRVRLENKNVPAGKTIIPVVITAKVGDKTEDATARLIVYKKDYTDPPAKNVAYEGTGSNGQFTDKEVTG